MSEVPDELRVTPTADEVARVAAWLEISVVELIELRDDQPLTREEIRNIASHLDSLAVEVNEILRHLGIEANGGDRP